MMQKFIFTCGRKEINIFTGWPNCLNKSKRAVAVFILIGAMILSSFCVGPAVQGWAVGGAEANEEENNGEVVDIADDNLREAVLEKLEKEHEDDITVDDMEGITSLNADNREVEDLTGLEYAVNLEKLDLSNNIIDNIDALAAFEELEVLYLERNRVSDISPLANLEDLRFLVLQHNEISDIFPLSGLENLGWLSLVGNQVSDISPLDSLENLNVLHLLNNEVSDISALSELASLEVLSLGRNNISDISPLSALENLKRLSFSRNEVSDISPLADLENLIELHLLNNEASDISPLSDLENLEKLSLSRNEISDISPLSGLENLEELRLDGNHISDITPLSGLVGLKRLYLGSNEIVDITPLAGLQNIRHLVLQYNEIADISPLSDLKDLWFLVLQYNEISDVSPLSELENIDVLYLKGNRILHITPLSGLKDLGELDVKENYLDISEGSEAMEVIEGLKDEGVVVYYEPQKERPEVELELFAEPEEGGTAIEAGTYAYGEKITVEAIPAEDHRFIGWIKNGDQVSTNKKYQFEIATNVELTAQFEPIAVIGPVPELVSLDEVDDIEVTYGTSADKAGDKLASDVEGVLDDGTKVKLAIENWTSDNYDAEEVGSYAFRGEVTYLPGQEDEFVIPEDLSTVSATVIVTVEFKYEITRLAGEQRYETAREIALHAYGDEGVDTVIIAEGLDFADGLAGSALAAAKDAPVLLTAADELSNATEKAIDELEAVEAVILGGVAAVSNEVTEELEEMELEVSRIAGINRIDTAAEIARKLDQMGKVEDKAFIVNGWAPADSLAIGPVAAAYNIPILQVRDEICAYTRGAIKEMGIENVEIIGGEGVVSGSLKQELEALVDGDVQRTFGENRFETSVKIAEKYFNEPESIIMANGVNKADALAAGYFGAIHTAPVLYVNSIPECVDNYLNEVINELSYVYILGGEAVVSKNVKKTLKNMMIR